MELKHLRYFAAAVEEGSLQGAAARLNVAQPALSRRVRDMEEALGCPLLMRRPRGVVPTRAGRALYSDAVRILGDLNEALQRARRLGLDHGLGVRMGLAPTISRKYAFVGEALDAFAGGEDGGIAFVRAASSDLVENLRDEAIDLALLYEQRPNSPQLCERLIHRECYVLAAHPTHPLAVSGPAELTELAGQPLVWLARRDIVDSVNPMLSQLRRHGLEPVIGQVVDSPEEQLDIAIAAAGICLTPASTTLALPVGKLVFRALPRLDATIDLTLAWRREWAGEAFLRLTSDLHAAIDRHQAILKGGTEAWSGLNGFPLFRLP